MKTSRPLANLSERQLLERFDDLVRRDRRNTAHLLAYIGEIDRRKIWVKHACSSMFAFCMERFHMSESMTAKRIWAARTARRFPVILKMVAKGELHRSGVNLLGKHLTEDNHEAVLVRAKHKSSREIEILVAELAPRPDAPSRMRALPRASACDVRTGGPVPEDSRATGGASRCVKIDPSWSETSGAVGNHAAGKSCGVRVDGPGTVAASESRGIQAQAPGRRPVDAFPNTPPAVPRASNSTVRKPITPLAPRRFKIEITVDQDTHDKLRSLQGLLRHRFSSADPALIVSRAIELLLDDTLKKKAALTKSARSKAAAGGELASAERTHVEQTNTEPTADKRKGADPAGTGRKRSNRTRAIPAAIRREVWKRDKGRCTFVNERGRRCRETGCIEYHHEIPYGKGGRHETNNITLHCRAHNQYQADLDFGREFMRRRREDAVLHSARNVRLSRLVSGAA